MKSSYFNNDINYGDIIKSNLFGKNPLRIVEFGILDGFSLKIFADTFPNAKIEAYDIFDEFNGNSAKKEDIQEMFKDYFAKKQNYMDTMFGGFSQEQLDAIQNITNISTFKGLGATSLLILVGVAIDTSKQVQTYLISKNYENIMK